MVFDEREWGAEDEAVHPQAQACQLHGKWVQVHAKDAALEEGAFQNLRVLGLVVQVQKLKLLGDLGALGRYQLLQVGICIKPVQGKVGQVVQRFY